MTCFLLLNRPSRSFNFHAKSAAISRSVSASCKAENTGYPLHHALPTLFFVGELLASGRRETVVLGAPLVLRGTPLRSDPSRMLNAMQSGVERSLFNAQQILGDPLDVQRDTVAVRRARL